MSGLHDLLRQLVLHGPARNDREREQMLGQVDEDEHGQDEPQDKPESAPEQPAPQPEEGDRL